MKWRQMVTKEPRLANLERVAREAGRPWFATWSESLCDRLGEIIGPGAGGKFPTYRHFEVAHRGLLMAWGTTLAVNTRPPWKIPEGETEPFGPALQSIHGEVEP